MYNKRRHLACSYIDVCQDVLNLLHLYRLYFAYILFMIIELYYQAREEIMRYYRFTSLLLIFALCSCSRSNDKTEKSSSPLSAEQISVETSIDSDTVTTTSIKTTQSQTIPATESDAPKTFPVPNGADGHEIKNHYSFKIQSDGVWVYYDDMKAQFLSADCSWIDSNSDLIVQNLDYWQDDFDFDGYYDLFIPEGKAVFGGQGHYFHFNVKTGLFVIWDEMDKLGVWAGTQKYPEKIIYSNINDENNNGEQRFYTLDDEKLVLIKRKFHYLEEETEEGHYYVYEYYTYENGDEQLYRRQRLYYRNGSEWPSIDEDLPLE